MNAHQIWIVDDDPSSRRYLSFLLEGANYRVREFAGGSELLEALDDLGQTSAVLLDILMPDITGEECLARIQLCDNPPPVIITSGQQRIETALALLEQGAWSYLTKPVDSRRLLPALKQALHQRQLVLRVQQLEAGKVNGMDRMIGHSEAMLRVYRLVERAARNRIPVLVQGESGSGKELVAQAIHARDSHYEGPFISLNCAAIPAELIESELFGHERGSFTGAHQQRKGAFESANGGTLFLDEIGELPLSAQAKLLRVLQEWTLQRVGGSIPVELDLRLITATKQNLQEMANRAAFRDDLFYRINHLTITLPPLRERRIDILPLLAHFLEKHGRQIRPGQVLELEAEVYQFCEHYDWPGNVRQLENALCRALAVSDSHRVGLSDFPEDLQSTWQKLRHSEPVQDQSMAVPVLPEKQPAAEDTPMELASLWTSLQELPSFALLRDKYLDLALHLTRGNIQQVARVTGISRSTIYRLLEGRRNKGE